MYMKFECLLQQINCANLVVYIKSGITENENRYLSKWWQAVKLHSLSLFYRVSKNDRGSELALLYIF